MSTEKPEPAWPESWTIETPEISAEHAVEAFRAIAVDGRHVEELAPVGDSDARIFVLIEDGRQLTTQERIQLRLFMLDREAKRAREQGE